MKTQSLLIIYLLLSLTLAGPVAFTTCMKSLGCYGAGCVTALTTCGATACLPPAYLACVVAAIGVTGLIWGGACIAVLLAPTPWSINPKPSI